MAIIVQTYDISTDEFTFRLNGLDSSYINETVSWIVYVTGEPTDIVDSGSYTVIGPQPQIGPAHNITGLDPGTGYVVACTVQSNTYYGTAQTLDYTRPHSPVIVDIGVTSSSIIISVEPYVGDNLHPTEPFYYELYLISDPYTPYSESGVWTDSPFLFDNLPSGTQFVVAVYAQDVNQHSSADPATQIVSTQGGWTSATPYIYHNGAWVPATPYIYHNGAWVQATPNIMKSSS